MTEEVKVEETVEQVVEERVELDAVEKAVEDAVAQNKELATENESLKAAATKADEELVAIKSEIEEIKAKQAAPHSSPLRETTEKWKQKKNLVSS